MKKIIFLILMFFSLNILFAQREANIWYFGNYAGLDFNGETPVPLTDGAMSRWEGVASFSDSLGNLLMYTDGDSVWNKNHQIMPNGDGLLGHPSSTESAIIVPYPEKDSLYYLFTVDREGKENGLCYSLINMNLDNGHGDIVPDQKNIQLITPVSEKVTAVRHSNNQDIWLITHGWLTDSFFVYQITPEGLNPEPDIYEIGAKHEDIGIIGNNAVGYLRASPTGTKLASVMPVSQIIEIFDFNNTTGEISNYIAVDDTDFNVYGVEFSPDASKLYVTSYQSLYQLNLTLTDSLEIANSYTLIGSSDVDAYFGAIQLATNGKIYLSHNFSQYLGVVHNPSETPENCNFELYGQHLGGRYAQLGLPNFIQTYFLPPDFSFHDLCYGDSTQFVIESTQNIDSVLWNFGDPATGENNFSKLFAPKHLFSQAGDFWVELIIYNNGISFPKNQVVKILEIPQFSLGNDTLICQNDTIFLQAQNLNTSYLWNTGDTIWQIPAFEADTFWQQQTDIYSGCTNRDSLVLTISPLPEFSLGNDTAFCYLDSLILGVNYPNANYLWNTGEQTDTIIINETGTYHLSITDNITCSNSDTIIIGNYNLPQFNLGNDTILCPNTTITLGIGKNGTYKWSDNSNFPTLNVDTVGIFWLKFADTLGCQNSDTINILPKNYPYFLLGNDTLLCEDETITLSASFHNQDFLSANFIWNDFSTDSTLFVYEKGEYILTATNICGSITDTLTVDYEYCGEIYIPNIITPNCDLINDNFAIKGIEKEAWELEILNRWGKTVFYTLDYQNDWDAPNQPDGIYYYILQNKDYNIKFNGFIHVYH